MIRRIELRYDLPMTELDARQYASRLHVPILVIHDREDAVVSFEAGRSIAAAAPLGELVETKGLGHTSILRAPEVVRKVADFIGDGVTASFADTLDAELFCRDTRWTIGANGGPPSRRRP